MIIKLSLALSSNRLQNLALPQPHQPPCPLSVLSDWVTGDSPLRIVYIIPQHSTLLAYGNLNGLLLLPSLGLPTYTQYSPREEISWPLVQSSFHLVIFVVQKNDRLVSNTNMIKWKSTLSSVSIQLSWKLYLEKWSFHLLSSISKRSSWSLRQYRWKFWNKVAINTNTAAWNQQ